MVESGGNTRLQVLKELWAESGDERFYRIHCLYRPWVSESHVLTAHLIENDKRGALTFIDKAMGVRELRQALDAEGMASLSQRQLADTLRERGYGLDQSMISRMDYAVDVLLPLIPEALRAGMGAPQVRRLRRLESACRRFWCDRHQAPERFEALFNETLTVHDGARWEPEPVQRALETRLAEITNLPLKQVRLEIDARLAGEDDLQETRPPAIAIAPSGSTPATGKDGSGDATKREPASSPPAESPSVASIVVPPSAPAGIATMAPSPEAIPELSRPNLDGPHDLKSLRSRCYVLALKIAKRHDLEDCVIPAVRIGLGFLIDVPREPIIPASMRKNVSEQHCRQWIWWLLLSLSEEAIQPERMEQALEDLLLRGLVLEGNETRALALVGEPDWKALGYELLSNPSVPQATIDDLWALALTCRHLRQRENDDGGLSLWQTE
jgi:ParB family protein of integrating conjugative element (PFGI_1 class)